MRRTHDGTPGRNGGFSLNQREPCKKTSGPVLSALDD